MKKKLICLAVAAASAGLTSCATLNSYCGEDAMRAAIRQLNPYDFIDAAAVAGCAGLEAFITEDLKMYDDKPVAVFLVDLPEQRIAEGDEGRYLGEVQDGAGVEVRIFGKTITVDAEAVAIGVDDEQLDGDSGNGDGGDSSAGGDKGSEAGGSDAENQ